MSGCSGRGRARAAGFTLIETLIALVVAATASAVILGQVRGLLLRAEKEREHAFAIMQLLNESVRVPQSIRGPNFVRLQDGGMALVPQDRDLPPVKVSNFVLGNKIVPPIDTAFTPFQLFEVGDGRYALAMLGPAVKSPDTSRSAAASSEKKDASAAATAPTAPGAAAGDPSGGQVKAAK